MNRITKKTMVALAIVAGIATGAFAQKKTVRLDPVSKDLYKLTYLNDGDYQIKVEVLDESGTKLLSEQINSKKSFTKPYNFQNLNPGEYSFKIIDTEGVYVTKIKRTNERNMVARILKIEDEKAKVIVRGEFIEPVSVSIFDKNDVLLFDDYIERDRSFTKLYDLSEVKAKELRLEVVSGGSLLAASSF